MTGDVVQLDDFRKKPEAGINPMDLPMDRRLIEQDMFAVDMVADQWANELVHELMKSFTAGGEIDITDPVYGKLMEGMADVARSMTRHHLKVFDETALMLQKYPDSEVSVGVLTPNDVEDSDVS